VIVMLEALIFVVFPFCMVYAAISDMVSMTIANRVSVILVVVFAIAAPLTGMDWATYGWHFAAGGIVLAVTFGMFAIGAMGGGDAKLLSATAIWMGLSIELLQYLVLGAVIGGVLSLFVIIYRRSPLSTFTGHNMFLRHFADQKVGVPYGVALGAAGLLVFPSTPLAMWALDRLVAG
jgi:prepilin peptidase CpaA